MTPDKARRLLDGTTPGPWGVDHDHAWAPGVWSPDSIVFGPYYDREDMEQWEAGSDADLRLAAAAPTLAAMRAEMREEWGYEYESLLGGRVTRWGFRDKVAATWDMKIALKHHWDDHQPTRVVRRYVTEPEEA